MSEYGAVTEPGTLRIERVLPGPIERVWAYLTQSQLRGKWLATGEMELRVGGRVDLLFRHADLSAEKTPPPKYQSMECGHAVQGVVTHCDPPRLLSLTWMAGAISPDSEVTFALTPRGKDVLLVLTHRRLADRETMTNIGGGWHTHLAILIDHLNGREPTPFWSTHARLVAEYDKRIPADEG